MSSEKRLFLALNVLGGIAVLGSYAHGLTDGPALREALWGGVPEALRPVYTANMFLAAAGFLTFTYLVAFRTPPDVLAARGVGLPVWIALYAAVLLPSALWLPLTAMMIEQPGAGVWLAVRCVLALVGLGSVGIIAALWRLREQAPRALFAAALAGAGFFALQTAVLDALVWPAFFPRG